MSFSFRVKTDHAPSFAVLLEAAGVRPELAAAGDVVDGWPRGLLQKSPDAATMAGSLAVTPAYAAALAQLGLKAGAFLAHLPGKSTRGVEVSFQANAVLFRVCALATVDDYELAARLAASLARLVQGAVLPEHDVDGGAVDGSRPTCSSRASTAASSTKTPGR